MISEENHFKFTRFVFLTVTEEAKTWLIFSFNVLKNNIIR